VFFVIFVNEMLRGMVFSLIAKLDNAQWIDRWDISGWVQNKLTDEILSEKYINMAHTHPSPINFMLLKRGRLSS
jgi:hypothetical protein